MNAHSNDYHQDVIQRIHHRLDRFEDRIEKLDGQMSVINKWMGKLEVRNDRMEEIRTELMQAIGKIQTDMEASKLVTSRLQKSFEEETSENKGNKEIILQLLENDRNEREKLTQMIDGDKQRTQERFLKIWAVLGPVLASVLTSLFTKFLL